VKAMIDTNGIDIDFTYRLSMLLNMLAVIGAVEKTMHRNKYVWRGFDHLGDAIEWKPEHQKQDIRREWSEAITIISVL
jgi:hypothetical protein